MGQRSQIYVRYTNKNGEKVLVARYLQDNFGEDMISRARGLVEWLNKKKRILEYLNDDIVKIVETDFTKKEVESSVDLISKGNRDYEMYSCSTPSEFIFKGMDNNDGKLFISVEPDGIIKYALTDCEITAPLAPDDYLDWDFCEPRPYVPSAECRENINYIGDWAELMTPEELCEFQEAEYANVETPESILEGKIEDIAGEYYNCRSSEDEDGEYNLALDRYRKEILGDNRYFLSTSEEAQDFLKKKGTEIMTKIKKYESKFTSQKG